jgi:translation initiation factor IF-2
MSATTVSQFAVELKMPVAALLEQLGKAGVGKQGADDSLTDQDKNRLLDYLRRAHGDESKTKITLMRKQTSEIKATDSHGRARTVQVEVRKKRVLVKRELGEHAGDTMGELADESHELPVGAIVEVPVVEAEPIPEPVVEPERCGTQAEPVPEPVIERADSCRLLKWRRLRLLLAACSVVPPTHAGYRPN